MTPYQPTRALHAADLNLLVEKRMKQKRTGERSFLYAAAKLWNGLPLELRICNDCDHFKSLLKTHLFKDAFTNYL